MKFGAGFLIVAVSVMVAPEARAQDDGESGLRKRLNKEMEFYLVRLRESVREIAREELAAASYAARIDRLANNLVDDPLHNRLKELLLSKFVNLQYQRAIADLVERKVEKAENGRLRVPWDSDRSLDYLRGRLTAIEEPMAPTRKCDGLGLGFTELSKFDREWSGIYRKDGLKITEVTEGGPAARAKLQKDDYIIVINATFVTSAYVDEVVKSLGTVGEFEVTYLRDRKYLKATLSLGERRPK